jgi:hypothetical protein
MKELDYLIAHFDKIRASQGEEAWQEAIRSFVREGLRNGGKTAIFVQSLARQFDFVDLSAIHAEIDHDTSPPKAVGAPNEDPFRPDENLFAQALRSQIPGLKSQGQINAFMVSFEAYREVVNSILDGNTEKGLKAREALSMSFEAIRQATELTRKLEEVPEAATSTASDDFRAGTATWTEYDKQRKLLSELEGLRSFSDMQDWWTTNRKRIDEVQTPGLRNPLLDLVRAKKAALQNEGT